MRVDGWVPIIVFLLILTVGGSLLYVWSTQRIKELKPLLAGFPKDSTIVVDPHHLQCNKDKECTLIDLSCASCSCGNPLNVAYVEEYRHTRSKACRDYAGGVCSLYCPALTPKCIEHTCVLAH